MLSLPCPYCGDRDETEFHYGGQAHVPYPDDPAALGDAEWGAYDSAGVHLAAEAAYGDFDPHTGSRFFGAQGWLGYRTRPLGSIAVIVPATVRTSSRGGSLAVGPALVPGEAPGPRGGGVVGVGSTAPAGSARQASTTTTALGRDCMLPI